MYNLIIYDILLLEVQIMNNKYKKKNIKKKSKPINKIIKNNNKYLPEIMEKRFNNKNKGRRINLLLFILLRASSSLSFFLILPLPVLLVHIMI